nr:MAG TPA: hypothetical protein [Caudoviricetes sp.]
MCHYLGLSCDKTNIQKPRSFRTWLVEYSVDKTLSLGIL